MTFQQLAERLDNFPDVSVSHNKYGDILVICQGYNALIIPKESQCWLQTIPTESTELIPKEEQIKISKTIAKYYSDKEGHNE